MCDLLVAAKKTLRDLLQSNHTLDASQGQNGNSAMSNNRPFQTKDESTIEASAKHPSRSKSKPFEMSYLGALNADSRTVVNNGYKNGSLEMLRGLQTQKPEKLETAPETETEPTT